MTTFKQIASNCFFDDDDHTDTLHIDKKIQQGKRYKTTGELDLEKAKEIDCEVEKVERTYTKPRMIKNKYNSKMIREINKKQILEMEKFMNTVWLLSRFLKKAKCGGGGYEKSKK